MDKYIDQFVAGFKFLEKFEQKKASRKVDDQDLIEYYKCIAVQYSSANYQELHKHLFQAAQFYANNFSRQQPLEHQCHSVHFNFQNWLQQQNLGKVTDFKMTVGNVIYKGNNVYKTSKTKIKQIINNGPNVDEALNLHVWLTLDDMTVYDLSIIPTLRAKGLIDSKLGSTPEVLVYRPGEKGDYEYQPLLVDDGFFYKVDKINIIHG